MIRPLRSVHRGTATALAVLLPALLASAWKVRHERPVSPLSQELLPGVALEPAQEALPDVLVYWSAEAPPPGAGLPADAEWVGPARVGAHRLPPPAGRHVVAFDLAHGHTVALEDLP